MARLVRQTSMETRSARGRLTERAEPYWATLDQGLHLGYRKRRTGGTWTARRRNTHGRYVEVKLGIADDTEDADGTTILNYRQAQEAARKWIAVETRRDHGLDPAAQGPYTVADSLRDYAAHYAHEGKAITTTQTAIDAHIIPSLGQIELAKLTTARIERWHKALAEAPRRLRSRKGQQPRYSDQVEDADSRRMRRATANRVLTILKAALNYAWKRGRVGSDSEWRRVRPFRNVDAPVISYLDQDQCRRLINACVPEFRSLVQAALFTGCRYGELIALRVKDYNRDAGTLAIAVSKSGKPRHVVLTDEAREFFNRTVIGRTLDETLFTRANGGSWNKSHQQRPMREACEQARITPPVSFHVLRHTHGSLLAMRGVPMPVIAQQLGHADTRMTEKHYAHLSPNYVADTIRANFPQLGIAYTDNIREIARKS